MIPIQIIKFYTLMSVLPSRTRTSLLIVLRSWSFKTESLCVWYKLHSFKIMEQGFITPGPNRAIWLRNRTEYIHVDTTDVVRLSRTRRIRSPILNHVLLYIERRNIVTKLRVADLNSEGNTQSIVHTSMNMLTLRGSFYCTAEEYSEMHSHRLNSPVIKEEQ
jgi:hypothetical protein